MATVDKRRGNCFWLPPDFHSNIKPRTVSHKHHPKSAPTTANSRNQVAPPPKKAIPGRQPGVKSTPAVVTQRHESQIHSTDDSVKAQDIAAHDHDSASYSKKRDSFPSIEELYQEEILRRNTQGSLQRLDGPSPDTSGSCLAQQQLESRAGDSQGSRESPVILEDDELKIPSIEAAVQAVNKCAVTPTKLTDHLKSEAWFDIEHGCYVLEDHPLLALEEDGLASVAIGQDQRLSPEPLQDMINQYISEDTQCTSEVPGPDALPQLLNEGSGQKCMDNVSELERVMPSALQEREDFSAATPSSQLPDCHDPEPTREQIDKEQEQSRTMLGQLEELKDNSPHFTQAEEDKPQGQRQQQQQQQQQEERAVSAIVMVENDTIVVDASLPELTGLTESRPCQEEGGEAGGDTSSECSGSGHSIYDEDDDDEDDDEEEQRPAKRRKRNSRLAPQTLPTFEQYISQIPRSSSTEPMSTAEYHERPFQSHLKRTRIRKEITYHLEYKLPFNSENLNLPIEWCKSTSNKDLLVSPLMHCKAPTHSKISAPASRPRTRVAWTAEDDTRLVEMKKGGSSWTEIFAEFPKRTPGTIQVRCSTTLKGRLA